MNPSSEENNDVFVIIRYKYANKLMNDFWTRFNNEYLCELRERHKVNMKRQNQDCVKLDDVVLIKDDKLPRSKWKIGVIEALLPSKDNQIRVAVVKTRSNGKTKNSSISIKNTTIPSSKCETLLGVKIDSELNFEQHILTLCRKANKRSMLSTELQII